MNTTKKWQLFAILLGLSMLSVLAVFPYVISLQGELLRQAPISLPALIAVQLIQSAILFSIAIFVGLTHAPKIQFQLPILEALLDRKNYKARLREIAFSSILWGIISAVSIFVLDLIFSQFGASITVGQQIVPVWQKLLASFYGGITEELLLRLFFMTLIIWIGMKVLKLQRPNRGIIMFAILVAAILFGLGHLPVTAALTTITPIIVARAILLNGVGGIIFGWLYWKKGLEAAMIAHFTADIFLLTVLPALFLLHV